MKYAPDFVGRVLWHTTVRGFFVAIRTVIWTPPHTERIIHPDVALLLMDVRQPTTASVAKTCAEIESVVGQMKPMLWPKLCARQRMGIFSTLMQFSMYVPYMAPYFRAECKDVERLYSCVVAAGKHRPVTFADQLRIALDIKPSMPHAVWLLLVTSRQYARWYDSESIVGMKQIDAYAAKRRMVAWSTAIVAVKPWSSAGPQDTAGDAYYVWTHALAKMLYGPMSPKWAMDAYVYRAALHIGTWLNHNIAHKISPQSINSDHSIAATYGNAIGKILSGR